VGWARPKCGCLITLAYYAFPRLDDLGERRRNVILTGEKRRTLRKTCASATLSTTNPTSTDPGLRGERPVTNDLNHGTSTIHITKYQKNCIFPATDLPHYQSYQAGLLKWDCHCPPHPDLAILLPNLSLRCLLVELGPTFALTSVNASFFPYGCVYRFRM
jgi:hypothetical protein